MIYKRIKNELRLFWYKIRPRALKRYIRDFFSNFKPHNKWHWGFIKKYWFGDEAYLYNKYCPNCLEKISLKINWIYFKCWNDSCSTPSGCGKTFYAPMIWFEFIRQYFEKRSERKRQIYFSLHDSRSWRGLAGKKSEEQMRDEGQMFLSVLKVLEEEKAFPYFDYFDNEEDRKVFEKCRNKFFKYYLNHDFGDEVLTIWDRFKEGTNHMDRKMIFAWRCVQEGLIQGTIVGKWDKDSKRIRYKIKPGTKFRDLSREIQEALMLKYFDDWLEIAHYTDMHERMMTHVDDPWAQDLEWYKINVDHPWDKSEEYKREKDRLHMKRSSGLYI